MDANIAEELPYSMEDWTRHTCQVPSSPAQQAPTLGVLLYRLAGYAAK